MDGEGRVLDGGGSNAANFSSGVVSQLTATEHLVEVARRLSLTRDVGAIIEIVRSVARGLTCADGAAFVLRDGELCFYADEDAIGPLWKGKRFPMTACISGWAMIHRTPAVVPDIFEDPRIPVEAYRPTFVRSLAVVPIRTSSPVGAIGIYWATSHHATPGEVKLLQALADLTSVAIENVALYSELQKRIAEAQAALGARDEFLIVAAHELNTPLTALQLQLQGLERLVHACPGCDATLAARIGRAATSAHRLTTLAEALLDVSRLTTGRLALDLEPFDLADAVRAVAERLADAARRAGCELALQLPSDRLSGVWDRLHIERVLTNLVANALKYGSGQLVEVSVEATLEGAKLSVSDRGIGVPPEDLERVFERFARAVPTRNYGGLGLGLYVARQLVEAHGGTIICQNRDGGGTVFTIEMPRGRPERPRA